MQNLRTICTHECVKAQSPRLIIITPPPVNEYKMEPVDIMKGHNGLQRTAEHTRAYANAARKVGEELQLPVLDLWSIFMQKAGWVDGEPLPGCRGVERNQLIEDLMYDGEYCSPEPLFACAHVFRAAFDAKGVQDCHGRAHESDCLGISGSAAGEAALGASCVERRGCVESILRWCCAAFRFVRFRRLHVPQPRNAFVLLGKDNRREFRLELPSCLMFARWWQTND